MLRNGELVSVLHKIIALSLVLLCLVACSNGENGEEIVGRIDSDGYAFSPSAIEGSFEYLSSMKAERVWIVRVDEKLNPIDSFEAAIGSNYRNVVTFKTDYKEYEYPYIKVVTTFLSENGKDTMKFAQYARLSSDKEHYKQNLFSALAADRIKALVEKEKYGFDEAEETALAELGKVFGLDLGGINKESYNAWSENVKGGTRLRGLLPYVYCRHEISDSLFYSDFKEFRDAFAETGKMKDSFLVRAADAFLSTFERVFEDESAKLYEGKSRDSIVGLRNMDYTLFENAYGINFPWPSGAGDTVLITDSTSAYYKRHFVMDNIWRLKSLLEEEIGQCRYNDYPEPLVYYEGDYYRCEVYSNIWRKETDRNAVLNNVLGECKWSSASGKMVYAGDTLYTCICEDYQHCSWSDKYANQKFNEGDSLYAKELDARAAVQFGRCTSEKYGDLLKLDSVFVECYDYKWQQVDSLLYYLGRCSNVSGKKGEHNGVYYSCANYWSGLSDTMWQEIYPPAYYDDDCSLNRVVKYDDTYYICESNECKADDGFQESGCFALRSWRKLDSTEMIPPVINMDTCERSKVNRKVVYDDVYYECSAGTWQVVDKDTLLPPEKDGLICGDSLFGMVKGYDRTYYTCDSNYQWRVMGVLASAPYLFEDSLGSCDTISKKNIHWYGTALGFYGCAKDSGSVAWHRIELGSHPNTMPLNYDEKSFAGGVIENDSLYKVTVDGKLYQFDIDGYNWALTHVEISGKTYDAYFYRERLFLHSERGTQRIRLDSIENKSESFDAFYTEWKTWAKGCSECQSRRADVDSNVFALRYNENAYMDWSRASKFCPEGFHVPSLEEFAQEDFIAYVTTNMDVRNDSPIIWDYTMHRSGCVSGNTLYFDILWTSTENDADTQHCVEIAWHPYNGEKGRRVTECPKDLYPMVQTLCVQDN